MTVRAGAILLGVALAVACGKGGGAPADEPAPVGRRVAIEVQRTGYVPHTIRAKPNEALVLVFTRTADVECGRFITVQGTDVKKELPLGEPVEVGVTAPASGELVFACGMDMLHGLVVVEPG